MKKQTSSYQRHRFPSEIISHAVWLYHRFCLSFREVEELLAERGITVTYETIRQWCQKFGPDYARKLKKRQGHLGDTWHIDEVFVTMQGERHYLYRAVDQDGDIIDILLQHRRNQSVAERFFRRLIKGQGGDPPWLVTDKLRSYTAAHRTIMPTVHHINHRYANNRVEVSHEPTRQRERAMRGFRSSDQVQRFLHLHGLTQNLFRLGRHLMQAVNYRLLRTQAFQVWHDVVCALGVTPCLCKTAPFRLHVVKLTIPNERKHDMPHLLKMNLRPLMTNTRKTKFFISLLSVAVLLGCSTASATAQSKASPTYHMDRTILPIHPPQHKPETEMDARNATKPERFEVKPPEGAPNVVIVLIDDIGFGATSTFGGAIATPTLDRLANEGLRFTHFHTTALCSPTRAALLSGRNHHEVNVGSVMEVATGFAGNQGERPDNAKYFAETLRQNGYSTAAFGKWHETPTWEVSVSGPYFRWPTNSGFDKFYGFIGGETNQWDPVIFDGVTKVNKKDDPDYHFTTDMTNEAINWVKFQQAMTPDKPFMIYYATGATHAPHHAPKEWIKKYDGKFDQGWLKYREETFARQKAMGIIPKNTRLAPMPNSIMDWEKLSAKERELYALQMEAFAGFAEQTDHEVGRLVDAIDEIGVLDNTLFIYIMGDNGSSGEGGLTGTYNELVHLNGIFDAETTESMLARADEWGGPNSFPHFSSAWAVATDAPFTWTKQMAADFGGTRNGMVMHWPKGIKAKGEIRTQWHHVNDVAATVLEATKLPQPKMVNGVEQIPLAGVSMLYAANDANAKDRHTTQYFEMFGNRAIYHDGWLARVIHRVPWENQPRHTLQEDVWELYNTKEDFSLTKDLAKAHPEKTAEMKRLFEKEAIANHVYPLDDRLYERFNAALAGRPDLMGGRTSLTLAQGMTGLLENTFINEKNNSKTVTANVQLRGNDKGIILCQGGKFGGWALYMNDGKPAYTYNWFGLESYTVASPKAIDKKKAEIKLQFDYDGGGNGKGGQATLFVDGQKVAEGRIDKTQPAVYSADETADVGKDEATQVADKVFKNVEDSLFTGYVNHVTVSIPKK